VDDEGFYDLMGNDNGVFGCMALLGCHQETYRWLHRSHFSGGRWPQWDGSNVAMGFRIRSQ
jgi:hypothetical protein